MNNYQENKQRKIFKSIFNYAYIDNIDMKDFIESFFASKEAYQILKYSDVDYFNPISVYAKYKDNHSLLTNIDNKKYNVNVINYCALIYTKFYQRTKESPKKILKYLPFDTIVDNYALYHTYNEERVIDISKTLYNLKLNPIRKQRSIDNPIFNLNDKTKLLFLAKEVLKKLYYYPEIGTLEYEYIDIDNEILINKDALLSINVVSSKEELSSYLRDNKVIDYYKFNRSHCVAFIFGLKDISDNELKHEFINQNLIGFDRVIVYLDNKVKYIDSFIDPHTFYIDITKKDIKMIEEQYNNRFDNL